MSETLFIDIIERRIPADIVFENDQVLAFKDINPQAPHHVLFIPKEKIRTINDVTEGNASRVGLLFVAAAQYARQIGVDEEGYRVVMNCNEAAGQTVFHIHLHFLAGRNLSWPPG